MSSCTLPLSAPAAGLHLLTGQNATGKSSLARELALSVPGAQLLSAESQQAFYEAELAKDATNFQEAVDHGTRVGALLGQAGRDHPLCDAFRLAGLWDRGYRQLSTGEGRKVLLLRALLSAPSLLVLDEPFDGLDAAAQHDLAAGIAALAGVLPLLVVGAFSPLRLPFAAESVASVQEVERGAVVFHGSLDAWRARSSARPRNHLPPPIDLGTFYPPLDAAVPLVQLHNGRVSYGDQVVFDALNLTVHPGQHTLIEGPNGSGKSTLLELITGDHPQGYSNDLSLFGRRRGTGETVWDIKRNVGLVSSRLHRDYRVGGSIEDALVSGLFDSIGVYRERTPSDRARAERWLAWLGIAQDLQHAFQALSFGEQRLVLIARAAIKVPPLIVLDEPTTGLDEDNRARVLELIGSLCSQRRSTVLFVTHRDDERDFWATHVGGARLRLGQ
jgi:molybdate transport system ATP-binding protein